MPTGEEGDGWVSVNEEQKEDSTFYYNLGAAAGAAGRILSLKDKISTVLCPEAVHLYDCHRVNECHLVLVTGREFMFISVPYNSDFWRASDLAFQARGVTGFYYFGCF